MFHSPEFLEKIEADSSSRWASIAGAGHWIHTQKPEEVEKHMRGFFAALKAAG